MNLQIVTWKEKMDKIKGPSHSHVCIPADCTARQLHFFLSLLKHINIQTHRIRTRCPLTPLPAHKRTINSECVSARVHMFRCLGVCVDVSGGQLEEGGLVFS